ncbi:MAG: FAD-dependent oxidoreductase [Pelagimonas sp.]|jgi:thioredoxin reductase|nr:FAD-dependent oxidoreductase [Pelagimonas sp.]
MTQVFDIAVIGAGPAGANAALMGARAGCRVVVLDEQPKPGGQVWRAKSDAILSAPQTPETRAGDKLRHAVSQSDVTHLGNTRVWQIERIGQEWSVHLLRDGAAHKIVAKTLILATGAREFVMPVPGWTTPGVIGLAGATALFKQDLTLPGERTVVSGMGPLVFFVASEIRRLGGEVAAVVTPNGRADWLRALPAMLSRPDLLVRGTRWVADLMLARVPIFWRHAVTQVDGGRRVNAVHLRKLSTKWFATGAPRQIAADSLCLGNGLIPSVEAAQLAGLTLDHRPDLGGWVPIAEADGTTSVAGLFLCGDGAGIRGAAAAELQGKLAGLSALTHLGRPLPQAPAPLQAAHRRAVRFGMAMTALSIPRPGLAQLTTLDTVICRCESLRQSDILAEIASGAGSTNAVKSGLRAGMGPCGGKYCQTAVARLIAEQAGCPESQVPPPTPRPPLRPVPASALAGDFDYDDLPIPKPAPL